MHIYPANKHTYTKLINDFKAEKRLVDSGLKDPDSKGYIERSNQQPINAFLNVSMRNYQNIPTRIGHMSLSLATPIHLDILAWAQEQPKHSKEAMSVLRDALILELVPVSLSRTTKPQQSVITS